MQAHQYLVHGAPSARRLALLAFVGLLLIAADLGIVAAERSSAGPIRTLWRLQALELATAEMTVGGARLTVELTTTVEARVRGLGYRDGLEPGTGMLFVSEEPAIRSFSMRGMRFCLDIIWIEGGQMIGAAESVCPEPPGTTDLPHYSSPIPVTYVLEVPAGWMQAHGIGPGSPVSILPPGGSSSS